MASAAAPSLAAGPGLSISDSSFNDKVGWMKLPGIV